VEANSTGGQGSRRAVAPSDDDEHFTRILRNPENGNFKYFYCFGLNILNACSKFKRKAYKIKNILNNKYIDIKKHN
jgi:hypothetical protein